MGWEAWLTLGTISLMALALVRNWAGPDTVMLGGLTLLVTAGLFSPDKLPSAVEAASAMGNEGLITIAVLFVVAEGLRQTGAMSMITGPLLGLPKSIISAQLRMMLPVAGMSAFLNNNPIVAMFMPVVNDWCKKVGISPSKLFIPLSYAAILGGTCTLIGTSTNLVVKGLVAQATDAGQLKDIELNMFTISAVGVPATVVGLIYILLVSRRLLPNRKAAQTQLEDDARQYTVEMVVEPGSPIDGKTIEQAGLRHLPNAYLAEIERDGESIVAVGPEQALRGEDRLIFVGVVEAVVDLQKFRGLVPATDQVFKLDEPKPNRVLVEAVVSPSCPLIGRSIRKGRFRRVYNAAILAVHRGGERLYKKIGDIRLQAGDTLLMETHPGFVDQQRNRKDFYLVSAVADSKPVQHERAWFAAGVLVAMVLAVTFTPMNLLNGAMVAAGLMILTKCISMAEARNSVDWRVLLSIAGAIGIGQAMSMSGAARTLADGLIQAVEPLGSLYVLLAAIYLLAMGFNMMIGHVGAAVLMFPIAISVALQQDISAMPFIIAIMMAASADFANPISYPTHLMVYGPGGYRFSDYVRIGLPLNFLVMAVTIAIAPTVWPFKVITG